MEDTEVFVIVKSQLVPCVVCVLTKPHKMRYRLLMCSSETCNAATPYDACRWKGKVLTCQSLYRVIIMETGGHETLVNPPPFQKKKNQDDPRLKDYGREMATQGLKPARIRNGMARRFGLAETEMPTLRQIDQLAYGPTVSDTTPFSFGWERDARGKPDVGNDSDENPFLVGLTTKRLLLNAARDPESFVFHMGATFKLNQVGYPVFCLRDL
ncbi:hypothetical protein L914_21753 [Phytophthora nicotianae]|uniref:Uncharacterized protein n=1 Tax=Phytophthora nicotianae TaxID=4792 RepID=W2M2M6_PHYNI|nr:hypothetical protein L914_21753 [Phytophthora nicotianae]